MAFMGDGPGTKEEWKEWLLRKNLMELCTQASVPEEEWINRESSVAQRQIGELLSLLRSGCEFAANVTELRQTWWVEVKYKGFNFFDRTDGREGEYDTELFYVPTKERLELNKGTDWY